MIFSNPKIDVKCNRKISDIIGDTHVKNINLIYVNTGRESSLDVDSVLVRVGLEPKTEYLNNTISLDKKRQILVNENMETEVPGIFSTGDICHDSAMQFVTAVGDGATVAIYAQKYLQKN